MKKIAALVKTRIEILPDIREQIDFFEEVPKYDAALYTHKKMKTNAENALVTLKELIPVLEAQEDYGNDALFERLKAFAGEKGYKIGYVMWPIRTAVSGKQNTPGGATEIMDVLGKEESLRRLYAAVEMLERGGDEFNQAQKQAVTHDDGPCLVLAGPGSGKTLTIVNRIQYLIEKCKVRPEEILVITITKYAAMEMKLRLQALMGGRRIPVTMGTFHGIYYGILKWAYKLGPENIFSEEEKTRLVRQIIDQQEELEIFDEEDFRRS